MLVNQPSYRGVRTLTHTCRHGNGALVLIRYVRDPYQMQNLVNDSNQQELMKELDAEMLALLRLMNDPSPAFPL